MAVRVADTIASPRATQNAAPRDGRRGKSAPVRAARSIDAPPQRLVVTFLTAAGLLLLFGCYCLATRSLQSQPNVSEGATPAAAPPMRRQDLTDQMARKYLAGHDWTASAIYQGQSHDGSMFYYCNELDQLSDKVVRLRPFALISKRKTAAPGDPPYIVVSDSAELTFASKVSFPGGNPGAIVQAGLGGSVVIEGPHKMTVWGRDFSYQRGDRRIFSDQPLEFRLDRHHGTAKGVQLELVMDDKARPDEAFAIAGVSSVKLLQNVDMTLAADSTQQIGPTIRSPRSTGPEATKIHSDGSFTYVLASHVATFERNIGILRQTAPGKYDRLTADDLVEVDFQAKSGKTTPPGSHPAGTPKSPSGAPGKQTAVASTPSDGRAAGDFEPDLAFKSIHAQGKAVSLISDQNELQADMREFRYDQTTRVADLVGGKEPVRVKRRLDRLRSPRIHILQGEEAGDVTQIWCAGPGTLVHYDEKTKQLELSAEWVKQMRKYPDPKSAFDIVELDEAVIEQPKDSSGIMANLIFLWVTRQGSERRSARPNMPASTTAPDNSPQIKYMLARQNVAMVSPQFEAETKRLEIRFEPAPSEPQDIDHNRARQRSNLVPTQLRIPGKSSESVLVASAQPEPAASRGPEGGKRNGAAPQGPPPKAAAPPEPYRMKADIIKARVIPGTTQQKPQVAEVIATGEVHLEQLHGQGAQAERLIIEGHDLTVQNHSETDQDMIVMGQPAHVHDRGSHIEGSRIHFNRLQNTADVQGAGKLHLPMKQSSVRQTAAKATPDQQRSLPDTAAPTPLDVDWAKQMRFDGRTASFLGTVHCNLDDGQSRDEIRCRQLNVTFTRQVSFAEEHQSREQPEIQTVECVGGVDFKSDATLKGQLDEVRRGSFAHLILHRLSGESEASGPGLLRVWRHSTDSRSGIPHVANVHANSPPKKRKSTSWNYTQVSFAERNFSRLLSSTQSSPSGSGALAQRSAPGESPFGSHTAWTSRFFGNVEVLYGPVDEPMETITRDELADGCGWLACETMEVTQHPQTDSEATHVTLLATGNAQIEGKDFRGEGDRISYDGSKGQYILRGDSNQDAVIVRQKKVGGDSAPVRANTLTFNPDQDSIKVDKATKVDGIQ
jgi:lipopolysaccharide export system protein LptA